MCGLKIVEGNDGKDVIISCLDVLKIREEREANVPFPIWL